MGLDFRSSGYRRYVRLGKRTIKDGEAASVWDMNGTHRLILGPKLVRLFYSQIRFLDRFTASSDEYLEVRFLDGRTEHLMGPVSVHLCPVYHSFVKVRECIRVPSAAHAVVYTKLSNGNLANLAGSTVPLAERALATSTVIPEKSSGAGAAVAPSTLPEEESNLTRRIVQGPCTLMPLVNEEIHTFEFYPKQSFQVLEQTYSFSNLVLELTTADQAKASVKVTIDVKIKDIGKFLDSGNSNLYALVHRSMRCDVASIGATLQWRSCSEEIRKITATGAFPTLLARLDEAGCELQSVLYLGVDPSIELAASFKAEKEEAMKKKNAHVEREQRNAEAEESERIADMKIASERARIEAKQELLKMQSEFDAGLKAKMDEHVLDFLGKLKTLGVDVGELLKCGASKDDNLVTRIMKNAPAFEAFLRHAEAKEEKRSIKMIDDFVGV